MAALPGGTDVAITHKFVSGKADGGDSTLVQPSKWNQNENMGAGADGQKVVRDSGQTDGASWVNYDSASFTNSTGAGAAIGDVVAVSVAADGAVVLDDTVSSVRKFVVALQTPANAAVGAYATGGPVTGIKAQGSIAAGRYFRKSATTKAVEDAGVSVSATAIPPVGTIGFSTTAAAGGFVNGVLFQQTATFESRLFVQIINQDAAAGTGCPGDTVENNLKSFAMAAGQMATDGDMLRITCGYRCAANATTKRIRLYFGASVIADSTAIAQNSQVINLTGYVSRTGATSQYCQTAALESPTPQAWSAAVTGAITFPTAPTETMANAITIKSTVQLGAGAALNDVIQDYFVVEYFRK